MNLILNFEAHSELRKMTHRQIIRQLDGIVIFGNIFYEINGCKIYCRQDTLNNAVRSIVLISTASLNPLTIFRIQLKKFTVNSKTTAVVQVVNPHLAFFGQTTYWQDLSSISSSSKPFYPFFFYQATDNKRFT